MARRYGKWLKEERAGDVKTLTKDSQGKKRAGDVKTLTKDSQGKRARDVKTLNKDSPKEPGRWIPSNIKKASNSKLSDRSTKEGRIRK